MNRTILTALAVIGAVILLIAFNAFFTVHQAQQAIVLQFGEPRRVVQEPGLHFKRPLLENVIYFDKRLLDFDADAQEVIMLDQRRLVVDAFARYRIVNPLLFFQSVGTEQAMRARLGAIVNASLRNVLGSVPFSAVLSARRSELMRQISDLVVREARPFGVEIEDVRIMRADLHPDNSPAIYARMQTEREREARTERAQGAEASQRIRAEAERDRTVIIAEAQRQAQVLRGQGDADATRIFAEAFNRDPQFYSFYRSLQAYRQSIGEGTTLVLTPESEFFRFFRDMQGTHNPAAAPTVPARPGTAAR
ncbi:MAG TPA: protease modulator HflC [Alphaproteobacteria bacterium]|nr:protease modulator HflC [Alphaproteobacteria bacterium]